MMSPNGLNFWGSLGQGLADATTGYDDVIKQQMAQKKERTALDRQSRLESREAAALEADKAIAEIYRQANGQPLTSSQKQQIASLLTNTGRFDEAQKVMGVSGSSDRYSKVESRYDPATGKSYNGYFDKTTGQTIYRDENGNTVDASSLQVDSAGRGKSNMSDPVIKESRTQETNVIDAGNRATRIITDIDSMEQFADQVNGEGSWFLPNTGSFNDAALSLERSGLIPASIIKEKGARGALDWMTQNQLATQIESMRGLGPMSNADLEMLKRRVLSGNMSPEEFKLVAGKMRQFARYSQKVSNDWKTFKKENPNVNYIDWIGDYDAANYADFINDRTTSYTTKNYEAVKSEKQSNGVQPGSVVVSNGRKLRFKGGDPKSASSWEEVR
ncbi:hypothetical protein A6U96_13990 [Agrobacterium tumefaciens]|nr:hypothetical protein A6U96_13990 [Agrobacterium tumefaciens]